MPRPEDVTSFESAVEPDTRPNNHSETKGPENVGRSFENMRDEREARRRLEQMTEGHANQRRGMEPYTRTDLPSFSPAAQEHQGITQARKGT